MPIESLDVRSVLIALGGGQVAIEANYTLLDDLNVFPVPDGDTGSNLLHTVRSGVGPVTAAPPPSLGVLAGTLRERFKAGSRGNSGFLFATFHDGFLGALEAQPLWDTAALTAAFQDGAYAATTSLMRPREGTMLSVMAAMAAAAAVEETDVQALLGRLAAAGREAVRATPQQLPLLRRGGVVDSGGLGFTLWIDGMSRALAGAAAPRENKADWTFPPEDVLVDEEDEAAGHRYCTEIIVANPGQRPTAELRAWLQAHGSSTAFLAEPGRIKLHVHLDDPALLRARLAEFGAEIHVKIEDMHAQIQVRRATDDRMASALAIVPGAGLGEAFTELGASGVLVCEEALPSLEEILAAVLAIASDPVLLLPNNSNILPVAMMAEQQHPDRIVVIPTRTPIQGLCAMALYTPGATVAECIDAMRGWDGMAVELALCQSARDAQFGGVHLPEGAYFAIRGDTVLASGGDLFETLRAGILALDQRGKTLLTLYRGRDLAAAPAQTLADALGADLPGLAVTLRAGGQGRSLVLVALE